MGIGKIIKDITQYITEGFVRIFSPTDDEYPAIGVQPFEGTIYNPNSRLDW
jgi:hypothetical protein